MKILIGVIAALGLTVGLLWWRLDVAQLEASAAATRASTAEQQLAEQTQQAALLADRFNALDASLGRLAQRTEANNRKLTETNSKIDQIQRTENDSLESLACLDVRVPSQLDDSLRHKP